MGSGMWLVACLLAVGGTTPGDVVPFTQRDVKIPIQVQPARRAEIKELILYVSEDRGQTWQQVASATPDKDSFAFYAPQDGEYWFSVTVVDQQGRQQPPSPHKAPAAQKILIDMVKPAVHITSAARQGEDIVVSWQIQDANPDLETLKLEYRLADSPTPTWYDVSLKAAASGQTKFRVNNSGRIQLRMEIKDLAGNVGNAEKEVAAATTEAPAAHWDTSRPAVTPAAVTPPPPVPNPVSTIPPNPGAGMAAPGSPWEQPPASVAPPAVRPEIPPPNRSNAAGMTSNYQQAGSTFGDSGARLLATSRSTAADQFPPAAAAPPADYYPRGGPLPPPQLVNDTRISIEYEVKGLGPSNIGSVELYLTKDDGRTWQKWADDPDLKSPIVADLPGEGLYGFRLVIHSGAGLSRGAPRPGDLPEMRVEVDTTPPVVELYELRPDPTRPYTLILTWTAKDKNLAAAPITLQWAERQEGTWNTIAAGLSNTNQYLWQLPRTLPPRVYLRAIARDNAGNAGIAETPEAVLVDLNKPEGHLLKISGARDAQTSVGLRIRP